MTLPAGFDGGSDNIYIYLPSNAGTEPFRSVNENSNMMCQFLPAISAERDFTVGFYSQCYIENTGSQWRYVVNYVHGGLAAGDYLFQLVERNIIDSAFYYPSTPTRTFINLYLHRSETSYNDFYDAFYIQSYRYFRKA
jgi:hypothetical protein